MKKIYNILTMCLLAFVLPSYAFAYDATEEITCDSGVLQSDSAATFSANWEPVSYNISYNLNDGDFGTNHPTTATYDTAFTVDNPTHAGATFAGWEITGMDNNEHTFGSTTNTNTTYTTSETNFKNLTATENGNITFTAKWTCNIGHSGDNCALNTYQITVDKNGGYGSLTVNGVTQSGATNVVVNCSYGDTITLPVWDGSINAMTKSGGYFVFTGWSQNTITCDADKTVTAQWGECPMANAGEHVANIQKEAVRDNTCRYLYVCSTGYIVDAENPSAINGDYISGTPGSVAVLTTPSCVAGTVQLGYIDSVTGDYIDTTPTTCTYDTTFNLPPAPTKTGYTFTGWELIEPEPGIEAL